MRPLGLAGRNGSMVIKGAMDRFVSLTSDTNGQLFTKSQAAGASDTARPK